MTKRILLLPFFTIFILFISSCENGKSSPIVGTWKLIEENGEKVTWKVHIKNYTDTHFSWHWASNENISGADAMGRYTLEGDTITETLDITSHSMGHYLGTTATLVIQATNDTLRTESRMNANNFPYSETWVRLK